MDSGVLSALMVLRGESLVIFAYAKPWIIQTIHMIQPSVGSRPVLLLYRLKVFARSFSPLSSVVSGCLERRKRAPGSLGKSGHLHHLHILETPSSQQSSQNHTVSTGLRTTVRPLLAIAGRGGVHQRAMVPSVQPCIEWMELLRLGDTISLVSLSGFRVLEFDR